MGLLTVRFAYLPGVVPSWSARFPWRRPAVRTPCLCMRRLQRDGLENGLRGGGEGVLRTQNPTPSIPTLTRSIDTIGTKIIRKSFLPPVSTQNMAGGCGAKR